MCTYLIQEAKFLVTGANRKTGMHRKSRGMRRIVECGAVYSNRYYFSEDSSAFIFKVDESNEDGGSGRLRNVGAYILTNNQ
jgi:hypothetical protein